MVLFLITRVARAVFLANVLMVIVRSTFGRVAEDAGATDGVVLDVIEGAEEFTVGTVHVRLVAGERDTVEDVGGLVEDAVHLLQRTHGGLGEEEVDHWDDECVAGGIVSMNSCKTDQ